MGDMSRPPVGDHGADRYDYVEIDNAPVGMVPRGPWFEALLREPYPDCRANLFFHYHEGRDPSSRYAWRVTTAHDDCCPTMARMPTPKDWFDQFEEEVIPGVWPPTDWPEVSPWCMRHWAPAVLMNGNGIGASLDMIRLWLAERGVHQLHEVQSALCATRICCALGDERMFDVWGNWPPPVSGE